MNRRSGPRRSLSWYLRWCGWVCLLGAPVLVRAEVRGTVINGTTGKPAAGVEVHLVVLEEGMQVAEKTQTDAQGRFAFSTAVTKPAMVRVTYQGVNYHETLSPGSTSVTLRIYDARATGTYAVERLTYLVQPMEGRLLIGREYLVQNRTTPPVTLSRPEGVFVFALPEGARPERVSVIGASGMPLAIAARPTNDGSWRIEHPLRPGATPFFVVTQLPYEQEQAQIREVLPWNVERVRLLVPEPMKVEAPGFRPLGSEQGLSVYVLDNARAGMEIAWSVSGRAPNVLAEEAEGEARGTVRAVAGPIAKRQWILLAALAAAFAMSSVFAVRRQKVRATPAKERSSESPAAAPPQTSEMAALKDELFALELQRQRGEISEEDYEAKRRALQRSLEAALRADAGTSS
ncbi:MAG: hypothetical protein N0A16_06845 [Blastocatellia bacterium]|nr:hypothetical protein [Blastocatellia bacterium]MCS7157427.1 hypothetical protein [Blastocatellia bacterium]MCX7752601.1 hypothetical protein [Blastocatellia bacterium]MDW8168332.1 hypothetical protein [Acidobacteriota bacterium]MDW8255528.1 hypothetical protein [Acidobacteriota bacterium]